MNPCQDVFISYGRPDSKQFTKQLNDRLVALGYTIWFDFEDIPVGVDYQKQVDDGIEKADNFVFIISPHSVNSPYCGLELQLALKYNKRIIPLMHVEQINRETWQQRNPDGTDEQWAEYTAAGKHASFPNMHPEIRKINWVYMREGIDNVEANVQRLLELLERHKDYVHQHTVLLAGALEWERNQKQTRYLLIGEERQQAEAWLATRFSESQPPCIPTDLHCEFITESIKNANNLMTEVFLCHSEQDRSIADQIRRNLMRAGITTWTHHSDIEFGSDFQAAMIRGMEEADNVIFLMSSHALMSSYCQKELDHALALHKRIIPLRIAEVDPERIPNSLQNLQYIDLTDNQTDADYQQDVGDLLRILKQDAAYYHEHKVLLTKALKWERQQRNPSVLLRGYELQHAIAWLKLTKQFPNHDSIPLQQEFIAESERQPPGLSLDVFISYSRADSDFARRLNDGLQRQGKRTWFDQESIASGIDFQQEIYRGIEASDQFLFILSPRSVKSPYCADEVEYAAKLNKRIVTVRYRAVEASDLHSQLAKVHWVDFLAKDRDFAANFKELLRTLDADPEHLRFHTRLLMQAIAWDEKSRRESLLLRGAELTEAEQWLLQAAGKQPGPTALQGEYVAVSQALLQTNRVAAARRQRTLVGVLGSLLVLAILGGGAAVVLYRVAIEERDRTQQALTVAEERRQETEAALEKVTVAQRAEFQQRTLAEQKTKEAEEALTQAELAQAAEVEQRKQAEYAQQQAQQNADNAAKQKQIAEQRAQEARNNAQEAAKRADEARRSKEEVEKQNQIAVGRYFAAQAEALQERPNQIYVSALLAIEAIHKLLPLSQSIADASKVLNDFLLLPWATKATFAETAVKRSPSPNGRYLAMAQTEDTIQIWNLETSQKVADISFKGTISDLHYSPNSQYLIIFSSSQTKLWDLKTNQEVSLPEGTVNMTDPYGEPLNPFSPDERYLLMTTNTGSTVWDLKASQVVAQIPHQVMSMSEHSRSPYSRSPVFSRDGQYVILYLVTNESESKSILWDLKANHEIPTSGYIQELSADGQYAILQEAESASLWNLKTNQEVSLLEEEPSVLSFSPNGTYIDITTDEHTTLWDFKNNQEVTRVAKQSEFVWGEPILFSSDERYAVIRADKQLILWDLKANRELTRLPGGDSEQYYYELSMSAGGRYLAISRNVSSELDSRDKTILWDTEAHQTVPIPDESYVISFGSDEQYVILLAGRKILWDLTVNQEVLPPNVDALAFSPDGQYVITSNQGNTAQVWNLATRQETARIFSEDGIPYLERNFLSDDGNGYIRFTPGNQYVLMLPDADEYAGVEGRLRVWNITPRQDITYLIHNHDPKQVVFSPNGQYVLLTSENQPWQIWEIETNRKIAQFPPQRDDGVPTLSVEGQFIFLYSERDRSTTTVVWSLLTNQVLPLPDDAYVYDISSDGRYAIIRNPSGQQVWDVLNQQGYPIPDDFYEISPDGEYVMNYGGSRLAFRSNQPISNGSGLTPSEETLSSPVSPILDGTEFSLPESPIPDGMEPPFPEAQTLDGSDPAFPEPPTIEPPIINSIEGVEFVSPNGRYAFTQDNNSYVLRNVESNQSIRLPEKLRSNNFSPWSALYGSNRVFSPNNHYLVFENESSVLLWEISTGHEFSLPKASQLSITSIESSSDGRYLALSLSGQNNTTTILWDSTLNQPIPFPDELKSNNFSLFLQVFSPNNRYLVFENENSLLLWEISTGREFSLLKASREPLDSLNGIKGSSDGRYLVFSMPGQGKILWDSTVNQPVPLPEGGAVDVIFSPSSRYLFIKGQYSIAVWLSDTDELIKAACDRIGRNLTLPEWQQYFGKGIPYRKTCDELPSPTGSPSEPSVTALRLQNGFAQVHEVLSELFAHNAGNLILVSHTVKDAELRSVGNPARNIEPFAEAVRLATYAAKLTQTAQTEEEWTQIEVQWETAKQLMMKVSPDYEKYEIAQDRVLTYQTNRDYASTQVELFKQE